MRMLNSPRHRSMPTWFVVVAAAWLAAGWSERTRANATDLADEIKPLAIGAPAPDFDLPGVDNRNHRLADFADARVLVVVFTCNHCPTAQAYEDRLIDLAQRFAPQGVAFVAISPNDPLAVRLDELGYTDVGDSFEEMKIRVQNKPFPFPYLYDGQTQAVSKAYGALATPHVFLFDAQRRLRYQGRIDDNETGPPTRKDLENAIEAVLAGRVPEPATTRVFGCSTKWSDKRESARESLKRWDAESVELAEADVETIRGLRQSDDGRFRLVNVWATWCGPCVAELPELTTIHRMYRNRNFELVTISLDGPDDRAKARETLDRVHLSARNLIFKGGPDALAEALDPEWAGPIPHTVLIDPNGVVLYRKTGSFEPLVVRKAIADAIGRTYAPRTRQ